ncbi:MAG: SDR family oxidoreductase [Rhodospirillaceae bacterium]|nr:SDR family oxidoreductase [Rhodospirillaceae bacterium]
MGRLAGKVAVVSGADNSVGRAVIDLARAEGATVVPLTAVADENAIGAALSKAVSDHGRLDLVVNAARRCRRAPIATLSAEDFMATFDAIGETAWLIQKHAILAMRKTGGGVVINIVSVLARVAASECAAVCAADRGVLMSTKSAALECAKAKDKIVVSAVMAGRIEGDADHWPDGALLPHAPPVTPHDVAEGVLFLATDGAAYMTGVELPVDGGFLAS